MRITGVEYETGNVVGIDVLMDGENTQRFEPVRHGHWENPYLNNYGHPCHCCSRCGFKASHYDKNYCPECGAKMDEVSE